MVRTLTLYKAQPMRDDPPVRDTVIEIKGDLVTEGLDLNALQNIYHDQGEMLVTSLLESLPGGTIDQLLIKLLQRRASYFIIPWEVAKDER